MKPNVKRSKMPRSQRAKQFAPFDALKGLGEALKKAEKEHEETYGINIEVKKDQAL